MSHAAATPPAPPITSRPPADAVAVMVLLLGLVAAYCFHLWPEWRDNPDLSHGFFAPFVFFLLIRDSRRHGVTRWMPTGPLAGLAVATTLLLGLGLFALAGLFAASLAWTHALVCILLAASLGCFLLAGLLILADVRLRVVPLNWISLTAILLWVLVSPLPDGTYARLTASLQNWVTGNVMGTLHLLGIPARQHGNMIELASTTVGVEEACSGIRSLISCVFAGFFFAAWQVRSPVRRFGLIVAAPILAIGMNFLRSLTLTLLANSGRDISGFWHDATGFGILGVTAIILAGLAILLESKGPQPAATAGSFPVILPHWSLRFFWTAIGVTVAVAIFYYANSLPPRDEGKPAPGLAALLPVRAPGWEVETPNDLYQFADILQSSKLMERTYVRPDGHGRFTQLTVYLAYWSPGQASVSRVASHTPDACWPGSGWKPQVVAEPRQVLQVAGRDIPPAEYRRFENNSGFPQNVWFWHVYDGRVINYRDPYSVPALFQIALQYGFRRHGDQYFIRISSNKPWSEFASEPLILEIFSNLSKVGL